MDINKKKPNPYIERLPLENAPSAGEGWGIAAFVGTAISGTTEEAVYVTSFAEFAKEFGKGSSSPYMSNSHLAYAVYDFFRCGGSACFIARAIHSASAVKATKSNTGSTITVTAKDYGDWANDAVVAITANTEDSSKFDISVTLDGSVLTAYVGLSNTATDVD